MVLKTELDQPVRLLVGHDSGPIRSMGQKMVKLELDQLSRWFDRRTGWTIRFNFFIFYFPPLSSFPSAETPTPLAKPPHWKSSSSPSKPSRWNPTCARKALPAETPPPLQSQPATLLEHHHLLLARTLEKFFLLAGTPPRWNHPPPLCWNPLRWKKLKSFPLFACWKPPTRRRKWKPTPQNPTRTLPALLLSSSVLPDFF